MALDLVQERQQAHAYLDRLPPEQLSAVRGLLETMLDPVSRATANAPFEDEEISAGEERAVAEAREWVANTRLACTKCRLSRNLGGLWGYSECREHLAFWQIFELHYAVRGDLSGQMSETRNGRR